MSVGDAQGRCMPVSGERRMWDRRGDHTVFTAIRRFDTAYLGMSDVPIREDLESQKVLRNIGKRFLNTTTVARWSRAVTAVGRVR